MKFLVFSDLHEEEDVLQRLVKLHERMKPDATLICGDISRSVSFAEEALAAFPDSYFIPGNWDSKIANDFYATKKNFIHGKRIELGELNLIGFGYSNITPFHTFGELPEEKILEGMSKLAIDRKSILLMHCPPKGYFDDVNGEQMGSASIKKIVKEKKPLLCIFGHIHDNIGYVKDGQTYFVKIPAAKHYRCAAISVSDTIAVEYISL